jgi:hypothetical protein
MIATHKIEDITFDKETMFLKVDGKTLSIPLENVSKKLLTADQTKRGLYTISPSGYGIHWPLIDEDLSIDNLTKAAI